MDSADSLRGEIGPLLDVLQSDAFEQHSVTRKLATKAAQRLALLVLPSLSAARRSDARPSARANLGAQASTNSYAESTDFGTVALSADNEVSASPDTVLEISEEVETCIGVLLQRLHDKGLTYEIQRGDYSVGSNVRDAACYVMWSFARVSDAATKGLFGEMRTMLATALVSVAVFDREPNVRRAASAAFQEHVGRHSAFPHGISVLQLADFFSVGNMRNAFVVASRRISEFDEYRRPLLRHLCTVTIYHWDLKTRELAVEALRELAPLSSEY
ncbi:hypothetical protein GGH95_002360, partial [Coemansia sp. RSA 1836]